MKRLIAVLAAVAVVAAIVLPAASPAAPPKNLVQTAESAGGLKTFVKLVKQAGLASTLSRSTKYTVFAPTNSAFARLPKATLSRLTANKARLRKVLLYHVVRGSDPASRVVKLKSVTTLEGAKLTIAVRGGKVFVNKTAQVTRTNMRASNGIIHVIDKVLIPKGV
jgi:uncharacterized surface protein with fasciclin (FAS1) repeats